MAHLAMSFIMRKNCVCPPSTTVSNGREAGDEILVDFKALNSGQIAKSFA